MHVKILQQILTLSLLILLISGAMLSSGCASARKNGEDFATFEEMTPMPEATVDLVNAVAIDDNAVAIDDNATAIDPEWSPQNIRPGSLLNIQVYVGGNREVDIENARVSDNGRVRLPLVGSSSIAGHSLERATRLLEIRYANFFVSPQVSISIVRDDDSDSFPWGFVTVLGRVKQQGRVAIPPTRDLTVSSAIQQAGGFDTSARITSIRVTRRQPNGESETFDVNMRNIGRRGRTDEDIVLQPNDVVFIPEMLF